MEQAHKPSVCIIGESGTTGLRLKDRLSSRDDLTLISIPEEQRKDLSAIKAMAEKVDIMFLCLPDDAAKEIAEAVKDTPVRLLDTSTAHRVNDDWVYGFPELSKEQKEKIASAKKVAVPGCHASGVISILYPLMHAGILPINYPLHAFSLTGYSGGGKKMIQEYDESNDPALKAPRQYGLSQNHKHLPEITKVCQLGIPPLFSPVVDQYYEGMQVSIGFHSHFLQLPCGLSGDVELEDFKEIYNRHYKDSKLISVDQAPLSETNSLFLSANDHAGKDSMTIHIAGNDDRILVISSFDNLGKGASGAALQCMNIMLGLPEDKGLSL